MDLTEIFCDIDDFCKRLKPQWNRELLNKSKKKRDKKFTLSLSEIMTLIVEFHRSCYRTFKHYYTKHVLTNLRWAFPLLVSYNRFVELMHSALVPLCHYLHSRKGTATGISFVDSTSIAVCNNRRIHSHKVFEGLAQRGKNSMGWFYGFKLHLIINDRGELLAFMITAANVDDRKPVPDMTKKLFGKLFGDRGYISQKLSEALLSKGVQLITKIKSNMKNKLLPLMDKILLRKRSLIETVNDQLKNISQVEHTRHRSVVNFMVNCIASLIAYTYQEKKPSLNIRAENLDLLTEF